MTHAPNSSNLTPARVAAEVQQPDGLQSFVVGLIPPAPASAYARATWRTRLWASQSSTALPSVGLHSGTIYPRTESYEHRRFEASSGTPERTRNTVQSHVGLFPSAGSSYAGTGHGILDAGRPFIRARTSRPALPPPSITARDTTFSGNINYLVESNSNISNQGYNLSVAILTEEGNYEAYETHLFLVDTGSDDTFVFGDDVLKVEVSNPPGRREPTYLEARAPWTPWQISRASSHTGVRHDFNPALTNDELRKRGHIGRMEYADGTVAHLGLLLPRTWVLNGYDWTRKDPHKVHLFWTFGVAFAVDFQLLRDNTSGILGLGSTGIQHAYMNLPFPENKGEVPANFLAVLEKRVAPVPAFRRGEKIAIYFCLRMAPELYSNIVNGQTSVQSWMSFNAWPCQREPEWNLNKILIRQPVNPTHRRWEVYLKSIKFLSVDAGLRRPVTDPRSAYEITELDFTDSTQRYGARALLDTGTSVTYFPLHIVQKLHETMFGGKTTIRASDNGLNLETYVIDPDSWVLKRKIQVVYEFHGIGGPVIVHGPFETFFYQLDITRSSSPPAESLVFPHGPSSKDVVLGLNFFQSMYISLHKATDGVDFVRMAGQWPEQLATDFRDFYLPNL